MTVICNYKNSFKSKYEQFLDSSQSDTLVLSYNLKSQHRKHHTINSLHLAFPYIIHYLFIHTPFSCAMNNIVIIKDTKSYQVVSSSKKIPLSKNYVQSFMRYFYYDRLLSINIQLTHLLRPRSFYTILIVHPLYPYSHEIFIAILEKSICPSLTSY